jgi:ribosomal protein S18 acetylase RimI-like enzyme
VTTFGIKQQTSVSRSQSLFESDDKSRVERLTTGCESDILAFLAGRRSHTAYLAGLIYTNGLESPLNRGNFYAYHNRDNYIGGVALIGHAVTFEATDVVAAEALARLASKNEDTVLIRGECNKIKNFLRSYLEVGRAANLSCQEQLLELSVPSQSDNSEYDLRPATPAELEQAVSMNVELALAESGNDPLKSDPEGFRQRLLRRIHRGQVWVRVLQGRVTFKAEIITRTPEVVYLEGIYVHRNYRGKGYGLRSMRQLGHMLLQNAQSICLFVNERNYAAQGLYRKAGYQTVGHYETIYLHAKPDQGLSEVVT